MRPGAEIDETALAIEADRLVARDLVDPLRLVFLADRVEERDGTVALPFLARDRLVAVDNLMHALFDLLGVLRREGLVARGIVVEAGLGGRAEGDLRLPIELLDRLSHYMRRGVAQDLQLL